MPLEPGSWFYPEDAGCVGWSAKPRRPFMLGESWDGIRPIVQVHPRTTTGLGIDHAPHCHNDYKCHVNCKAQVVVLTVPALSDCLEQCFDCLEPEGTGLLKELGLA